MFWGGLHVHEFDRADTPTLVIWSQYLQRYRIKFETRAEKLAVIGLSNMSVQDTVVRRTTASTNKEPGS